MGSVVSTTTLVLIRHGETDWNVEGRYQGQADPPLNRRGFEQAYELAGDLRHVGLELLYSSPLLRARQTAAILAELLRLPMHLDARLMEINQGDWQTRLRDEIEMTYPNLFQDWLNNPWKVNPPGGESLTQVRDRVYAAVDDICTLHRDSCVGIVGHRIPIILVKHRFQRIDPQTIRTLSMDLPNVFWEEIEIV